MPFNEYGRTEMPSSYDQWRTAAPDEDEGEGCQWCDYTGNCQECDGSGEHVLCDEIDSVYKCEKCNGTGLCSSCHDVGYEIEPNFGHCPLCFGVQVCLGCNGDGGDCCLGTGKCSQCSLTEEDYKQWDDAQVYPVCHLCNDTKRCPYCIQAWDSCDRCCRTDKCPECTVEYEDVMNFAKSRLEDDDYFFIGNAIANGKDWRAHFENNEEDDAT